MRKMILLRIGSRNAQLPRMIGAFLVVLAVLMLIKSGAVMFDSWKAIGSFDDCIENASRTGECNISTSVTTDCVVRQLMYMDCRDTLNQITGAQVPVHDERIELWKSRQFWIAMMGPISQFFAWAIALLIGLFMWTSPSIIVPVETLTVERPERRLKRKKKRKK